MPVDSSRWTSTVTRLRRRSGAVGDCVRADARAQGARGRRRGRGSHRRPLCGGQPPTIPGVTYTAPRSPGSGRPEEQLRAAGRAIKTGSFPFAASGRARAGDGSARRLLQRSSPMPAATIRRARDRAHGRGADRGGRVGYGVLASSEDLQRTIHAHPTLAEAMHEAALAVDKRAIDAINR